MTCRFCDDFISTGQQNVRPKFGVLDSVEDWESLIASATRCAGCSFLQKLIEAAAPEFTTKVMTFYPFLRAARGLEDRTTKDQGAPSHRLIPYVSYKVNIPGHGRVGRTVYKILYLHSPQETPWPWIQVHPFTRPDPPYFETAIPILQSWISRCDCNHQCVDPAAEAMLPTRLIDVGSESASPRLCQPGGISGKYLALSHCWGPPDKQPIRTLHENFTSYCDGIPLHRFPPTFRDAILVTRALGFQYIWIDSLCIIQDSPGDWAFESSRMADVYSHASLTLAADFAESAESGLFLRDPSSGPKIKMFTQTDSHGNDYPIFVRVDGDGSIQQDMDPSCLAAESTRRLETRGWAMQERLLSKRIVFFTNAELIWECAVTQECSCGKSPGIVSLVKQYFDIVLRSNAQEQEMELDFTWYHIVENYTSRMLTHPSDRLPGLTGVANVFPRPPTEYLAGIWVTDLAESLLWSNRLGYDEVRREIQLHSPPPLGENEPNFRIPDSSIPSWSWASISAPVTFMLGSISEFVRGDWVLIAAKCVPRTVNPYGPVSEGYIEIEGYLISVGFTEVLRDYALEHTSPGMVKAFRNLCVFPINQADNQAYAEGATNIWMDAGLGAQEWLDDNYDYFSFILGDADDLGTPIGMILRKMKRADGMDFSRIGISNLSDWRGQDWRTGAPRRRFRVV